jgi:hypothetical protein
MTNDKVAREKIAEMLFELGLKLKGINRCPVWKSRKNTSYLAILINGALALPCHR